MRLLIALLAACSLTWSSTSTARVPTAPLCTRGQAHAQHVRAEGGGSKGDLQYAKARYLDPSTGRFLSLDPVQGVLSEPLSTQGFTYANGNPTRFVDPTGETGTMVGAALGLAWGFGQMVGSLGQAAWDGNARYDVSDALGVFAQNFIGGVEMGAAFDVAAMSGGLAIPVSGALGNAGFGSLTLKGKGKSAEEFATDQVVDMGVGAALGPVFAKVAPVLGGAARLPGVSNALAAAGAAAENFAATRVGQWATSYAGVGLAEQRSGETLLRELAKAPGVSFKSAKAAQQEAAEVQALIEESPVIQKSLEQLKPVDDLHISIDFKRAADARGLTTIDSTGEVRVRVWARSTEGAIDTVESLAHELNHAVRQSRSWRNGVVPKSSQQSEFLAEMRARLFRKQDRLTLDELNDLRAWVQREYPELPSGLSAESAAAREARAASSR